MLRYRPAREDEFDRLFDLMQSEAGDYLRKAMKLMNISEQRFKNLFMTVGELYAIYDDERIAGFYWIEKREKILHLHGLVVSSEFQGRGIGRSVMKMLEDEFKDDFEIIELGVHESNIKARDLYQKLGYTVVRKLPEIGFLVMQKRLKRSIDFDNRRIDS